MIAGAVTLIGLLLLWQFAHKCLVVLTPNEPPPNEQKLLERIALLERQHTKLQIELERLRDEQAKVYKLAEDAQKLMSQANIGIGFKPFKQRD